MSKTVNESPQLWQARAHAKVNLHLGVGEALSLIHI